MSTTDGGAAGHRSLADAVVARVVAGDGDGVLELLTGVPERQREALVRPVRDAVRAALPVLARDRAEEVRWADELVTLCLAGPRDVFLSALPSA
ncbi:hypothetical protein, partial [Actinotalea ferrariae]|uniref:hypothetical protein n=1 Tax=Actinotalea ferrariae TaxID=1386098 RepID=UPI0005579019